MSAGEREREHGASTRARCPSPTSATPQARLRLKTVKPRLAPAEPAGELPRAQLRALAAGLASARHAIARLGVTALARGHDVETRTRDALAAVDLASAQLRLLVDADEDAVLTTERALLRRILARQGQLLDEIHALRVDLAGRGAQHHVDQDQAAGELVRCIALLPRGVAFSVAELLAHAQVAPDLEAAIVASVGALNGKRLGKLLRRIEGMSFDGASIVRCGASREGISWLCDFQNHNQVAAP